MKNMLVIAAIAAASLSQASALVGFWEFDGNLNPKVGSAALTAHGKPLTYTDVTINGVAHKAASFSKGLAPGGRSALADSVLEVTNVIGANGGGTRTNSYSVMMDIFLPTKAGYHVLYQTDENFLTNLSPNDGDWFIHNSNNGLGISGDYTDTGNALRFTVGTWQRLVLTINTGATNQYRSYIDGVLQNVVQSPSGWGTDGRFSLGSKLFVFGDEDGEYDSGLISSLGIFNRALTAEEVRAIGAAGSLVPEPGTLAVLGLGALAALRRRRAR